MGKLNIKNEYKDQQQEKHGAYLDDGLKLKSTKQKDGLVVRTYIKVINL